MTDQEMRAESLQAAVVSRGAHAKPEDILAAAEVFYQYLRGDQIPANAVGDSTQ